MRKMALLTLVLFAFGCKQQKVSTNDKNEMEQPNISEGMKATNVLPEKIGEAIFNGKGGCAACHKMDTKLIGPSLQEIATRYQEKNLSIVEFLKGKSEAIVSPDQYAIMQPSISLTKTMTDDELKGLEVYIKVSFEVYSNENKLKK